MTSAKKVWACVVERMDEDELLTIIAKNSVISLFILAGAWIAATFIVPILGIPLGIAKFIVSFPIEYSIMGWSTFFVFSYVFRLWEGLIIPRSMKDIDRRMGAWWKLLKYGIFIAIYYNVMLTCGELIGACLIIVGILLTAAFVLGEATFTSILTYRDLKKWVENIKSPKQPATESADAQIGTLKP